MSFISETIEKLKENILLASVICFFFLGGIGIGSYYLFTRSSDNTVQKENEEDKKEVVNEEITPKEEKTENEENNQEIEIQEEEEENIEEIKPTFLLDYRKTTLVIQIVIELIIIFLLSWFYFIKRVLSEDHKKVCSYEKFSAFLSDLWKTASSKYWVDICRKNLFLYLIIHSIMNFLLPLIAAFTSGNSYLSLLKNYWKKHFNNLENCLIFIFWLIMVTILITIGSFYILYYKSKNKLIIEVEYINSDYSGDEICHLLTN